MAANLIGVLNIQRLDEHNLKDFEHSNIG